MDTTAYLPRHFRAARLDLEVLRAPLSRARGTEDIVQIDIGRARGAETFRLFPGAPGNRIEVLGTDPRKQQLVLFVDEPRRRFEVTVNRWATIPPGTRVVRKEGRSQVIEQFTTAEKRHFLCGMDEQHLFIAQLPCGASSVHAAHEALRAPEVPPTFHDRRSDILRQGEWFFLPVKPREVAEVELAIKKGALRRELGIAQAARLARAGRPHVADEIVVLFGEAISPGGPPLSRGVRGAFAPVSASGVRIYVRGGVRHPDHKTVEFREFRRVVPNRERFAQPAGVYWVD